MLEEGLTVSMRRLADLLESRTGQTLSENRHWRFETTLKPIMKANGLHSLDELTSAVLSDPAGALADASINALLNNETSFFRDAHIFRTLASDLLPELMCRAEAGRGGTVRIWCAGCSTGQEAYSLAMLFRNKQERWPGWRLSILATDISTQAVERAKSGLFTQIEVQRGLPVKDLLRWFEPVGEHWRIDPSLRRMIDFRADSLFENNAPAGTYDLVLCRNVLLYFSGQRKKLLFETLSRHSAHGGYLLLGAGETVMGHTADFAASPRFRGIYQRAGHAQYDVGL